MLIQQMKHIVSMSPLASPEEALIGMEFDRQGICPTGLWHGPGSGFLGLDRALKKMDILRTFQRSAGVDGPVGWRITVAAANGMNELWQNGYQKQKEMIDFAHHFSLKCCLSSLHGFEWYGSDDFDGRENAAPVVALYSQSPKALGNSRLEDQILLAREDSAPDRVRKAMPPEACER